MKTQIINLYGGPGCGKSTLAAQLYYLLKNQKVNCELVREYVKDWAWEKRKVSNYDQPYILGKQIRKESILYNKVDAIITDSPLLLSPFYHQYYSGQEYTLETVKGHIKQAEADNIHNYHFRLQRYKPYNPSGRYETEEEAYKVDEALHLYMRKHLGHFITLDMPDEEKAETIMEIVLGDAKELAGYNYWSKA